MAEVNWDFAVHRWAATVMTIQAVEGGEEVELRCKNLPQDFKAQLIATLRGGTEVEEYNQD